MPSTIKTVLLGLAFVATIIGANYALDRWGAVSIGFGLMAPAGVYFAGLAFGLRDALQDAAGQWPVIGVILVGGLISWLIEDSVSIPGGHTSIAVASACAFLLSELADLAVYSPLRERQWGIAVVASNVVGALVDTALFLWLAFGSMDFFTGQVVGKIYMIVPALLLVGLLRNRKTTSAGAPVAAAA